MQWRDMWRYVRHLFTRKGVIRAKPLSAAERELFSGEQEMRDAMAIGRPIRNGPASPVGLTPEYTWTPETLRLYPASSWVPCPEGTPGSFGATARGTPVSLDAALAVEVYPNRDGRYKWRLRAADGAVHQVSKRTYARRRDALRSARRTLDTNA